ncbi:MAG: hypothetical protein WA771_10820, partial [Chthoniobacterales bacterium]
MKSILSIRNLSRIGFAVVALASARGDDASPVADRFLAEVLVVNPGVDSARLEWEAMAQMPEVVSSLPDPMVSYGYYFQSVQTRTGAMR